MSRKNIPSEKEELEKLITNYEAAKAENRQLYLDGDQLADISDWYASRSKFEEAQEAVTYGLQLHPGNTDLLVEQAYLYLDTRNLQKAKQVLDSITEAYDPEVKMLKAELLLNEGQLEETRSLLATIEDADELGRICEVVYLYLEMGYPDMAKEWMEKGEKTYSETKEFMALQADYALAIQQLDSAIKIYNQLLDIEPYNTPYWTGLAKCYFFQSKWSKAIEACDFALATLPIRLLMANYKESSKAKALAMAMDSIDTNAFDIVVIMDADNITTPDFLSTINRVFDSGIKSVQAHRTGKNLNTDISVLDSASEEINNGFFRSGDRKSVV